MKENWKQMPNNRGYVWKEVSYYGHLDPEEPTDTLTMFDKHFDKMFIYEYTPTMIRKYEKLSKQGKKQLIYEKPKK